MKTTIESTTKMVELNGVPARIWEGHSETGVPVHCYITRIAAPLDADHSQFVAELQEHAAPSAAIAAIPLRLIL